MARTRQNEPGCEEWSCPLCTLLNTPEDDRCVACDNTRPPANQLRKSQSPEPLTAVSVASDVQQVHRPSAGVFFSSLPRYQSNSGDAIGWRQETRLVVNRRRGIRRQNVTSGIERQVEMEHVETGTIAQNTGSAAIQRSREQESKVVAHVQHDADTVAPTATTEREEERQEVAEEEDAAVDVDEPCFNLLGLGASVFAPPVVNDTVEDQCAMDETKRRDGIEEMDADDDAVTSPPPQYPGFIPASKVLIHESNIEEKLASAGLDLSDSEDEEEKPKHRTEEKEHAWEEKWVCQVCTSLNEQAAMECLSCSSKRYQDSPHTTEPAAGSHLRWACHVCTNLNPSDVTDCLMCLSTRKLDAGASPGASEEKWKCSLCATFNAPGTTRCELCDRSRGHEPQTAARKGLECPVCTNINAPGSTRCELCDSTLCTEPNDRFVDLSSSPTDPKSSYTFEEDDLENPYADLSQYNAYDAPNEAADADPDYVEDISDNEPSMSLTNPRPLIVRSQLKEFEHFVCMEDLHNDYGCRINFSKMFAGQRSNKSYADRLATRQAQSRKRKRYAAQREAGGTSTPMPRGSKAARGGKKRKASAAPRRASAGGAKTLKGKKARKTGAAARRTSSATTHSSGVNHYDDSVADLGEDLNTMAWEGVGSAGYL